MCVARLGVDKGPCSCCLSSRSDTMDSVKQSAALCLLRLYKTSPDLVLMGEWTSRVVHLLNDQHMVCRGDTHTHACTVSHALALDQPSRHIGEACLLFCHSDWLIQNPQTQKTVNLQITFRSVAGTVVCCNLWTQINDLVLVI